MSIIEIIADCEKRAFLAGRKPVFLLAGPKEIDAVFKEGVCFMGSLSSKSEWRHLWVRGDMEYMGMITGMMECSGIAVVTSPEDHGNDATCPV